MGWTDHAILVVLAGWSGVAWVLGALLVGALSVAAALLAAAATQEVNVADTLPRRGHDAFLLWLIVGVGLASTAAIASPWWIEVPAEGLVAGSLALLAELLLGLSISAAALFPWTLAGIAALTYVNRREATAAARERAEAAARVAATEAEWQKARAEAAWRAGADVDQLVARYLAAEGQIEAVAAAVRARGEQIAVELAALTQKPGRDSLIAGYRAEAVENDAHLRRLAAVAEAVRQRRAFIEARRPLVLLSRAPLPAPPAGPAGHEGWLTTTHAELLRLAGAAETAAADLDAANLDSADTRSALSALADRLRAQAARCDEALDHLRLARLRAERPSLDLGGLLADLRSHLEPLAAPSSKPQRLFPEFPPSADLDGLEAMERDLVADLRTVREIEGLDPSRGPPT